MTAHAESRTLVFLFRAASREGRIRWGIVRAPSAAEAARALDEHGLSLLRVRALPVLLPSRRVRRQEVAVAFRNISTLVAAGVPIERAIAASEPLVQGRLAAHLGDVRKMIREGRPVAQALEAFPETFARSVVGMVRAGESGGSLAAACEAAADQLEESSRLESRVRAALAYPALILLVGLATVSVMGTVVVPRFAELIGDLGAELPPSTRALMAASALLERFGLLVVAGSVAGLFVAAHRLRSPDARMRLDRLLLRTPLVGDIRLGFASARTCRALGGMLETGMPLLQALDAAGDATGDLEVARRLKAVRSAVARGARLTDALEAERALDASSVQLVGVGETSGRLGPMVSRAAEVAAERAERSLRTAVALLEPLLVLVLGVLVALVAAALLQAVYSIRPL
jgi:general secretion pathway protein F